MTTRLFYARALIVAAAFKSGPEYEQALVAVMTAEDSLAWWNPLDTTLFVEGAKPYNTFAGNLHVWDYPSAEEGIAATSKTLRQPNMAPFAVAMRRQAATAVELARAFSLTPWGGFGDLVPLEVVHAWNAHERDYVTDRSAPVGGPGPWPYSPTGALHG